MLFSYFDREKLLSKLKAEPFDLLIIGGGITGAGIALDAASRGLKTALIEKNDFAFGTSSRSTKLIHGGLRYLKQLEFGLVKEVGSERAVVHNLAPHLVVPEKMLLPLSEKKSLGYLITSIGLKIYDWLAGVRPEDQRRMLSKLQTLKREPLLRKEDVKGGAIYVEYRTDDARLTIEVCKKAAQQSATVINYVAAKDFVYQNGKVAGVKAVDVLTGEGFQVAAAVIVNAAGPWVDELREINQSKTGKRLHLTKGVHVVLPREKLPVKQAIYFDVDDGRMIFAIPRGRITYVGTTDTNYSGDKNNVTTSKADADYLINAVNLTFPSVNLTIADIESSWAGLRPLIHEEGKSASELSRKDEIFHSPSGLISIAGGKLTGYRKMAERVVDLVIADKFADRQLRGCETQRIKLPGSNFAGRRDIRRFTQKVYTSLKLSGFSEVTARYLVENYGKQAAEIFTNFESRAAQDDPELCLVRAELAFCVKHEMVVTLQDFFVRRTGLINFNIHKLIKWKKHIAEDFKSTFQWSEDRMEREVNALDLLILSVQNFK